MLKEELLADLNRLTEEWSFGDPADPLTAEHIAQRFSVRRNTVSHYLNQAVEEERAIKINTRPVYFLGMEPFARRFGPPPGCVYASFEQLRAAAGAEPAPREGEDPLCRVIGSGGSLKRALKQLRAAMLYPGLGLPVLITGPTGVGKSHLAHLAYEFCRANGVLERNAPFLTLNCAQYADNPELLSSNLFGHMKGSFTGAGTTVKGVLEAADGGVLFLDEVHRLDHVGQEKLFTFMDQGMFRRMGESEGSHTACVRLIFATTEEPEQCLLSTFLRRIPIQVRVPALAERRESERLQLIYHFLLAEARRLACALLLSRRVMDLLVGHVFPGNLGDLSNTIQYLCATCFARQPGRREIQIDLYDLPEDFSGSLETGAFDGTRAQAVRIAPDASMRELLLREPSCARKIIELQRALLELYHKFKGEPERFAAAAMDALLAARAQAISGMLPGREREEVRRIAGMLRQLLVQAEPEWDADFDGGALDLPAYYLFYREPDESASPAQREAYAGFWHWCRERFASGFYDVPSLLHYIENRLDFTLDERDYIFFWLFMYSLERRRRSKRPRVLILAHGSATASSIAAVANCIYHAGLFDAFDMPLDAPPEYILKCVTQYLEHTHVEHGLIMLVDTGSLRWLYRRLEGLLSLPVVLINNVSTQLALQVGSLLQQNISLETLLERVKEENTTEYQLIQPPKARRRALLANCITGVGTASKISRLLEESLPAGVGLEVLTTGSRRQLHETSSAAVQSYDILAVIGTAIPQGLTVPYIPLEDLMSGRAEPCLRGALASVMDEEQIGVFCANLVHNFSLDRLMESLTILDNQKVLVHVEQCMTLYQELSRTALSNGKKYAIYVHVSCLIERLIRQVPIDSYPDMERLTRIHKGMVNDIRQAFHRLEELYSVSIPLTEIGYLCDILLAQEDSTSGLSSFDGD